MGISIRKLAPEEAQRAFPRRGQQDLSEYVAALREIEPGEAASIDRQGLSDRAIKRRLGQAAKSLGYRLKWRPAVQSRGAVPPSAGISARPGGEWSAATDSLSRGR